MAAPLDQLWPDPDRRADAVTRVLLRVHEQPWPHEVPLAASDLNSLRALAAGLTPREAGETLGYVSDWRRLRSKLQAKTNAHAVAQGFRRGLLS